MVSMTRLTGAPAPVRKVAYLLLTYSFVVLAMSLWYALSSEFTDTRELVRGLVRVVGMTGLTFWLLTLDKRAWWVVTIICGIFTLMGSVAIVFLSYVVIVKDTTMVWQVLRLAILLYLLGHTVIILARRETRDLFRRSPPPLIKDDMPPCSDNEKRKSVEEAKS